MIKDCSDNTHARPPRSCALAMCLVLLLPVPPIRAQEDVRGTSDGSLLASFVPESAGLFVSTADIAELDRSLRRAQVWRLTTALLERPADGGSPPSLREALRAFLGGKATVRMEDLAGREVALAAPHWSRISHGVVFIRAPDSELIDRWFPAASRAATAKRGRTRSFRTEDGLVVLVRDDVLAVSRHVGRDGLLIGALKLLGNAGGPTIEQSIAFQRLRAHLPPRALATGYVRLAAADGAKPAQAFGLRLALEQAVFGLYEGSGRLDVAVHGSANGAGVSARRLGARAVERMVSLPRTTLMALAASVDVGPSTHRAARWGAGLLGRAAAVLGGLYRAAAQDGKAVPAVGPNVIAVWDQDLAGGGLTPQLGLLLECGDATRARDAVSRIVEHLLEQMATASASAADGESPIRRDDHLGVTIMSVPLEERLAGAQWPLARFLRTLEPAWAASGDWLMAASTRGHLERMLDARFGLAPTIGMLHDVRQLRDQRQTAGLLFFMQGDLAAGALDRWVAHARNNTDSLLAPQWWSRVVEAELEQRSGLILKSEPAGTVRVDNVRARSPVRGVLRAGDRIVGMDGRLLDLQDPAGDFRRRWVQADPPPGVRLRVLREGRAVEFDLPPVPKAEGVLSLNIDPAAALAELADALRSVPFATFVVHASDGRYYAARLSVRLAPAS